MTIPESPASENRSAEKSSDRSKNSSSNLVNAALTAGDELGSAARVEFNNIMADLQDLVSRAGKLSGQELAAVRHQIADKLGIAREKLSHLSEDATAAATKGVDNTEKLIKDYPFQAIGIAAVAGLLLGAVLSRR